MDLRAKIENNEDFKEVYPEKECIKLPQCQQVDGKWMLFPEKSESFEYFTKAKTLFDNKELEGICNFQMEWKKDKREVVKDTVALLFYCGPSSDEEKMKKIGQNLVEKLQYKCKAVEAKSI